MLSSQVNKEIVSGLKYIQQLFRKGVRGEKSIALTVSLQCDLQILTTTFTSISTV